MGTRATRIVVSTFGAVVALAGIEHGVGEILQGSVRPEGLAFESWADSEAFEILAGEPAMTVIPNHLVTGILAVIAAVAVGIWALGFVDRRAGGLVLILLSVLLLLVGGGFGPPLIGIIIGVGATRIGAVSRPPPGGVTRALGRVWPWILAVGVLGYLSLVPGTVILSEVWGVDSPGLVIAFSGWLDFPIPQQLALHLPLALAGLGAIAVVLACLGWIGRWWSRAVTLQYAALAVGTVALVAQLAVWRLIGLT